MPTNRAMELLYDSEATLRLVDHELEALRDFDATSADPTSSPELICSWTAASNVPMAPRSKSLVETWRGRSASARRRPWVPLPLPGRPSSTMRLHSSVMVFRVPLLRRSPRKHPPRSPPSEVGPKVPATSRGLGGSELGLELL